MKVKQRKGLSPQAKRNLANGFGSLISNQRAIDAAKEFPLWVGIIFLLVSIFIPTIPSLVNTSKTYGSQFISTTNYGTDTGLAVLTRKLDEQGYSMKIEGKDLKAYKEGSQVSDIPAVWYDNAVTGEHNFRMEYVNKTGKEFEDYCTTRTKDKFKTGTTVPFDETQKDATAYIPSFIVFSPNDVFMGVYKTSTTTGAASSYRGVDWNNVPHDIDLIDDYFLKGSAGKSIDEARSTIFKNYCSFFDKTYLTQKGKTMAIQNAIFMSIYLGLVIFMGLLVFLLTRGKRNVFRYLSFFTCEKISTYAALSPAILAMILGFIFAQFAQMMFIILFGLRVMWLTMRQLRPETV